MSFSGQEPPGTPPTDRLRLADVRTRAQSSSFFALVEPILIIMIGLALGLVDQASFGASAVLRVPALIAALVLVGQGVNLLSLARQSEVVVPSEPVAVGASKAPGSVNRGVDPGADEEGASSGGMAKLVLLLAIWLGLATLANPTAPVSLILLSLLSAYLLFARGWKVLTLPRR